MMMKRLTATTGIIALFILFFVFGGILFLISETIVAKWLPPVIGLVIAIASMPAGLKLWIKIPVLKRRYVACICHIVVVGALTTFLVLLLNYTCAHSESAYEATAVVNKKYIENRTRYRRVGRNRRIPDGTYQVYNLDMVFPDGTHKGEEVAFERYRHTRKGDSIVYTIQPGLFGWPVYKNIRK